MNGRDCVLAACAFRRPARIPRFDSFWELPSDWNARLGRLEDLSDILIWKPDETPFPSRARLLRQEGDYVVEMDAWGRTTRRRQGAYFVETLDVAVPESAEVDSVAFESPSAPERYLNGQKDEEAMQTALATARQRHCVFAKTGGPFLRTAFLRGEAQFLMDIAADPPLAQTLAERTAWHLTAIGVEAISRWALQDTGIWIYDDMASNLGPMFRPESFERVFLPAYRRMIQAYKRAGAKYVFLHSDGDVRPLLDMLVDAGIDGLNPLERRANMHPAALRERYPRLILAGGMDNTDTLIHGPIDKIRAEAREIIDLGRDGGVIIGTHSLSPEIPLGHFVAYHETCLEYGDFSG